MEDYTKQFLLIKDSNDLIFGLKNLTLQKNISISESYGLGSVHLPISVNSPETYEVSFTRSYMKTGEVIDKDKFLNYTGFNSTLNAVLYASDTYWQLNNLYLTNYSAGFSIGELPKISTKFISYEPLVDQEQNPHSLTKDDIKNLYCSSLNNIKMPGLKSICIYNTADSDANEITLSHNIYSFDYSLDINRQPIYSIGSSNANISTILPIKINFSVNSKIPEDQSPYWKRETACVCTANNYLNFYIAIDFIGYKICFPITNAYLMNSEISLSTENTLELKRNYIGYYGL